jgi:hypothetical protein
MRRYHRLTLAEEEAAARRRTEEADRPRDGWQLVRSKGTEIWRRSAGGHGARVWGRHLTPPWHYEVYNAYGLAAAGEADTLADAMILAELPRY